MERWQRLRALPAKLSMNFAVRLIVCLLFSLTLAGCASYTEMVRDVERELIAGNPQAAIRALDSQPALGRDDTLYHLNQAMLLRMAGDFAASNAAFEKAKTAIEQKDAVSVSEQAGTLVVNESLKSFVGEDFERALLHLYSALNYLQLAQPYEARVEVLQVNLFLESLAKKKSDDSRSYTEDALCRYLAGMIYEDLGEWSDALISYRKAYEAYEKYQAIYGIAIPEALKHDLLRLTKRQGLTEEYDKFVKAFDITTWRDFSDWQEFGEVVLLLHNGLAPEKYSNVARFPILHSGQLVSVALPAYARRPNPVQRVSLKINDETILAQPVENIEGIAIQSLDDRLPGLTAKAIARATLKYNVTKQAHQQGGDVAGLIFNIAGALSETADTRTWFTLPAQIYMARSAVSPGVHNVTLRLIGRNGEVLDRRDFGQIVVRKGKKTFLEHYYIDAQNVARSSRR